MAFFAGGGGHNPWQPRKTMRDWGKTEYRIIRNWTPREQRGSGPSHPKGSSAHSANAPQAVGGDMEDAGAGLIDHNQEEEDMNEVRREGGGRLGTSQNNHEELQLSREQANDRTRQKSPQGSHAEAEVLTDTSPAAQDYSPPANSRLMSHDHTPSPPASHLMSHDHTPSPPANSRLMSFSNRTTRTTIDDRTTHSPTVALPLSTLHQSQVSHDTAADRSEDDSSGSEAEDPDQRDDDMELLTTSSPAGRSRTAGTLSRSLARNSARRGGRISSDSRPRVDLGASPVVRSQRGSSRLAERETHLPDTSTRQKAVQGGKSRGRGRGRSKGGRQQEAPTEKVRVRLWQPRHTSRTARDLGELDVCLSLYHDQLREALDSAESVAAERVLVSHWKATQKQVLAMIRDVHIIKALEKRLNKERAKYRRLQQDMLTVMSSLRRTNGDYQHALDEAKRAQKADELSAKKAEIRRLTRTLRPLTEKCSLRH